jgi:predicted component of type VI protein secretion system
MRATRTVPVLAVLVALAAAGCTSSPHPADKGSGLTVRGTPSADVSPRDPATGLVFPVDAYRLDRTQFVAIENSIEVIAAQCARRFGITYTPYQHSPTALSTDPNAGRYGITDAAVAAQHGYQPADPGSPSKNGANGGPPQGAPQLAPDQLVVLTGFPNGQPVDPPPSGLSYQGKPIPAGGCEGEARTKIGLGLTENYAEPAVLADIEKSAESQAEADTRVIGVMAAWSNCMKTKGFSYKSIWDPNDKQWADRAEEINTAVADVACKQQVNLVGIWYGVEVAYQKALIQQNIQALNTQRQRQDEVARKAAAALTAG